MNRRVAIQGYSGCFHEEAARRFYSSLGEDDLQIVECDTFGGLYEELDAVRPAVSRVTVKRK